MRALLAAILLSVPALAQQHPNALKGFNANNVYQVNDYDSINAFNGNLTISIPIGGPYPITSDYSVQLTLHSNANVWDPHRIDRHCSPDGAVVYTEALANRRSNAGMGWSVSLGRVLTSSHYSLPGGTVYEAGDGADHKFAMDSTTGTGVTRDSSYLRLKTVSSTVKTVEFPNGMVHTFEATAADPTEYHLRRIARGTTPLVEVETTVVNGLVSRWQATAVGDSAPFLTVDFQHLEYDGSIRPFARKITRAGQVYELELTAARLARQYVVQDFEAKFCTSTHADVQLLTAVIQPDATRFEIGYDRSSVSDGLSATGLPIEMTLPSGASVAWEYGPYEKPSWSVADCAFNTGAPESCEFYRLTWGVTKRTVSASPEDAAPATTVYNVTFEDDTTPGDNIHLPSVHQKTTVTDGTGKATESYFFVARDPNNWDRAGHDYGRPFSPIFTDGTSPGRSLSQRVYDGTVLRQSTYVRYHDDSPTSHDGSTTNPRITSRRVVQEDDSLSTGPRYVDSDSTDWAGLGRHRVTTVSGTGLPGTTRTTTTGYKIYADGEYPAVWRLDTYDFVHVTESTTTGGVTTTSSGRSDYCFDAQGLLIRKWTYRGATRATSDLVTEFTHDSFGNVLTESFGGGDLAPLASLPASACDQLATPLLTTPSYKLTHAYTKGVRRSTQHAGMLFKSLDLAVDGTTGLPTASTDPAGVKTTFTYDTMDRLASVRPDKTAWTQYVYKAATATAGPSVEVREFPYDDSASAGHLPESRYYYDRFGRLIQESRRIPTTKGWVTNWTSYDKWGRKVRASVPVGTSNGDATAFPGTAAATAWVYDALGRITSLTQPDGSVTTYTHTGSRIVKRTFNVQTESGTAAVSIEEEVDPLGRLRRVKENATEASAPETFYAYDFADRLRLVTQGVQKRHFNYDAAGLLTSEVHPESGTTTYSLYDARGHATERTVGGATVTFTFDGGGRLTEVKQGNSLLKKFNFNAANGRLDTAQRFNYHQALPNGQARVDEHFTYGGPGGRLSAKRTVVTMAPNTPVVEQYEFEDKYGYDARGDQASVTYPRCSNCGFTAVPRMVTSTREYGFTTDVGSYTSSIEYSDQGTLAKITRAKSDGGVGPVYTQTTDSTGRPLSFTVSSFCEDLRSVTLTTSPDATKGLQVNTTVTITATAYGVGTTAASVSSWQWYQRSPAGDQAIAGATSATLVVTVGGPVTYYVKARNSTCSVDSTPITIQPCTLAIAAPGSVTAGAIARAFVTATAGGSYQWTVTNATIISGQYTDTLEFKASCTGPVQLSVTALNSCGTSETALLNVSVIAPKAVVSGSTTLSAPGNATLKVDLTGQGPWLVTWQDGWQEEYQSSPAMRTVSVGSTTTYAIQSAIAVPSSCPMDVAGAATITVGSTCSPPSSTISAPTAVLASHFSSVSVPNASSYQWTITNGVVFGGSDDEKIFNFLPGCTGSVTIKVVVTNSCGGTATSQVTIPIDAPYANITTTHLTYIPGESAVSGTPGVNITFSVDATVPTIKWSDGFSKFHDGMNGRGQAGTRTVAPVHTTTYSMETLRDRSGCVGQTLGQTLVTVCPRPDDTIAAPSAVVALETNTASVTATPGASYAWVITNGDILTGVGTPNITFRASCSTSAVRLKATVTPGCGNVPNDSTVTIPVAAPKATLSGSAMVTQGSSTTLQVALSGPGPWDLKWADLATVERVTVSPYTRVVRPNSTTTYSLESVSSVGPPLCAGTVAGSATVTVLLPAPAQVVAEAISTTSVRVQWTYSATALSFRIYRNGQQIAANVTASPFTDLTVTAATAHVYKVEAVHGTSVSPQSAPDLATTVMFPAGAVLRGHPIDDSALVQLRSAVNAVYAAAGYTTPYSFTDPDLTNKKVKAVHFNELRSALAAARSILGLPPVAYLKNPNVPGDPVYAAYINELRGGVR